MIQVFKGMKTTMLLNGKRRSVIVTDKLQSLDKTSLWCVRADNKEYAVTEQSILGQWT